MLPVVIGLFLLHLLGHALYSIYAVYHLNEYGYSGDASQLIIRAYTVFSCGVVLAVVVAVSYGLLT